jgi:hypothetical protein
MRAVITVGDAIEVPATKNRSTDIDPISRKLWECMSGLLETTKAARRERSMGEDA